MKTEKINFYEGIRIWEYCVGVLLSVILVLIPVIVFSKISGSNIHTSSTMLVVVLAMFIAVFLKERRLNKDKNIDALQKAFIWIIGGILLINLITIIVFFLPYFSTDNVNLRKFENEYTGVNYFYSMKTEELNKQLQDATLQNNTETIRSKFGDLASLNLDFVNQTLDFCERARREGINIEKSEFISNLSRICLNSELFRQCETKSILGQQKAIEFLYMEPKTEKQCLEVLDLVTYSEECQDFYRDSGENITRLDLKVKPFCDTLKFAHNEQLNPNVEDTMKVPDTKTYIVDGKYYEITVIYLGRDGVVFDINGESSELLQEGNTVALPGYVAFKINRIYHDDYDYYVHFSIFG